MNAVKLQDGKMQTPVFNKHSSKKMMIFLLSGKAKIDEFTFTGIVIFVLGKMSKMIAT